MTTKVGKNFSVEDPPGVLDPNLMEIASFLSVYLNDSDNFYKFGAQLLSSARVQVMNIKQDENTPRVDKKCLALIKLWIKSVDGAKWQDLIPAAGESGFKGLATALTDELGGEPVQRSVERDIRSLREDNSSPEKPFFENETYVEPKSEIDRREPAEKPEINASTLEKQYEAKIKRKMVNKEQLTDLESYEILIQTVNPREFQAAMLRMNMECDILCYCVEKSSVCPGKSYYYVGNWGEKKIPVVIVQTTMGSDDDHGSYYETKKALSCLPNLKFIFAVGVCGGFIGKVKLGQVVVSKDLQDCSGMKINNEKIEIRSHSWQFKDDPFFHFLSQTANTPTNTTSGMVLSANNLVADAKFQKQLLEARPGAIALEMEGHGIARACQQFMREKKRKIQFLVVKGVSDLADEKKSDNWQPQAASNAVDALYQVMAAFKFGD